jgi:hypothetical protein
MSQEKCPYCSGSEIVANIRISQTAEVGKIGLSDPNGERTSETRNVPPPLTCLASPVVQFLGSTSILSWIERYSRDRFYAVLRAELARRG